MGDCTRPSRQQIDKKSSTTERASPQGASFDTPKCGSPAPAKRMLRVLNAVTGLGEPHQVLRRSWRSPTTVHTDRPNVTSRLQGMNRQPTMGAGQAQFGGSDRRVDQRGLVAAGADSAAPVPPCAPARDRGTPARTSCRRRRPTGSARARSPRASWRRSSAT